MFFRQFASLVSTWLCIFLLCMFIGTLGILIVLSSPTKMKTVVSQSGLYESLISGILEQIQGDTNSSPSLANPLNTIPLDRTEVQSAIRTAFPASVLQNDGNMIIDSIYQWLQGNVDQPNFKIDLSSAKANFALAMGSYIQNRLGSLPVCTVSSMPPTYDAFNATCIPKGLDITAEVRAIELQVATSDQFLPNPVLSASTFNGSSGQPLFYQLDNLPTYYKTAQQLPYIFALLAFIAALFTISISFNKRAAFSRLGIIFVGVGIFFMAASWLFNSLFQHFTNSLNSQTGSSFFTKRFSILITQADRAINHEYLLLGLYSIGAGLLLLLILKILPPGFKPHSSS